MFLNFTTASQAVSVSQVGQQHQLWEPLLNHPRICSLSSNLDALTTELLEALRWAGSKFNYKYTTHRGLYRGLSRNRPFTSVWDQDRTIWFGRRRILRPESSENPELQVFGRYDHWAAGVSMASSLNNRHIRIQAMNNILQADQALILARGARGAQWWEHSPPTNVAGVQLPATPYVGWVCCWFSPLLREVFSGYSCFPLSSKTNTYKFQFDLERTDTVKQVHVNS